MYCVSADPGHQQGGACQGRTPARIAYIIAKYMCIYKYIYSNSISSKMLQETIWVVVSTPLRNTSQLGWLFPPIGENKRCSKPPTSNPSISIQPRIGPQPVGIWSNRSRPRMLGPNKSPTTVTWDGLGKPWLPSKRHLPRRNRTGS